MEQNEKTAPEETPSSPPQDVPAETGTAIVEFQEFDKQLLEFLEKYDDVVYDLTDPAQDKIARSDRYALGKAISALDARHKELKAPLKAQVDLIDGERKRIKDGLLEVQGKIKKQIESHEQKLKEHEEMLQGKVDQIRQFTEFGVTPTTEEVTNRLTQLRDMEIDDSYEHRKADATLAHVEVIRELEGVLAEAAKREADAAELEALKQEKAEREKAEHEERIRKEAEEKARREAEEKAKAEVEKAQREKAEAEAAARKAEEDRKKAEEEAVAEAERQKKEAEEAARQAEEDKKRAIEKAQQEEREKQEAELKRREEEKAKKQAEEEARKSKVRHRQRIHKEIRESLQAHGFTQDKAKETVKLLEEGLIKHVFIDY